MCSEKILVTGTDRIAVSEAVCSLSDAVSRLGYAVALSDASPNEDSGKSLIICDHTVDGNTDPFLLYKLYDAVFFVGDDSSSEGLSQLSILTGHPHLRIIGNRFFENRSDRLIREVLFFLGEPEPLEIERKFLVQFPDISLLSDMPLCRAVKISQTYLTAPDGERARIRRRGEFDNCLYYHTVKKRITDVKRIEIEKRITEETYLSLLNDKTLAKRHIEKKRYCISYDSQYFELDVFPFWCDRALLEIELCSEDEQIRFPHWVNIIKEVTDDKKYTNSALAKDIP